LELRHCSSISGNLVEKSHKVTFFLDLPDSEDVLLKSFKAKVRSQIKRPLREDMYAKSGGLELLDNYYKIFSYNMRDLGTPVYSKKFFKSILQNLPDNSKIIIVYSKHKVPVASAFLLMHRDTVEIPWASSLREYNKFSPNMLLYWEVLKFCINNGYKKFDFGRCSPDTGTHRFKKQWGGVEKQLYWHYFLNQKDKLPDLNPNNPRYNLLIKIWQKLPVFATNFIGPHLIKNIP